MPNRKKAMAQAMGTVIQPTWPAVQKGRMVSQHSRKREVCLPANSSNNNHRSAHPSAALLWL